MIRDKNSVLYRTVKWLWLLLQALILAPGRCLRRLRPQRALAADFSRSAAGFYRHRVLDPVADRPIPAGHGPLSPGPERGIPPGRRHHRPIGFPGGFRRLAGLAPLTPLFFATLVALAVLFAFLTLGAWLRRVGHVAARLAALPVLFSAAGLVGFMMPPLRSAFSGLPFWRELLEWLVLAANSGLIVFSLYRFSIFAPPMENGAAYDLEWQRWAAPTIITLILSAAAAAVVAGSG